MKERLVKLIEDSLDSCIKKGLLTEKALPPVDVEYPREATHGDYATNIAMLLAKDQRKNPRLIAQAIIDCIDDTEKIINRTEIAGPGFINFFIREDLWTSLLEELDRTRDRYGYSNMGEGQRVQVEFVSANPTGPLHIGHARGAVVGDVIAALLEATGHDVSREYYINDAGNQMNLLGLSVYNRYLELLGQDIVFPDNCYQGEYIRELSRNIVAERGEEFLSSNEETALPFFRDFAATAILEGIKEDLKSFGVVFNDYFSEKELYRKNGVTRLLETLETEGHIYREGTTLWFRTTAFSDEKDRVVVRENGDPTYFAADIAYHKNKYDRGFERVIDIWGADHHGYIPRMYAGIQALGKKKKALEVILVQLVNLLRNGVPVAMSTRSGEFVTLREVIDEVGRDAARYNFLMRRANSHLDFDLELAKRRSNENPVYYVQYAHARISSIIRTAKEENLEVPRYGNVNLSRLTLSEELEMVKTIDKYPELIEASAKTLEPHRITFYLNDLASLFHSYYNKYRVISDDSELTRARLFLVDAVGVVVRNGLRLIGVSAPERM